MALRSRGYNVWVIATQVEHELKNNLLDEGRYRDSRELLSMGA